MVIKKDQMVRQVLQKFRGRLAEIALDKLQRESAARIERVYQRAILTKGVDLSQRTTRLTRNALTFAMPMRLELY